MDYPDRDPGESALIVNIGDLSGIYGWSNYVQHGVSKAGIIHLTRILARELAPAIRVNCIVPGPTFPATTSGHFSEEEVSVGAHVPVSRPGTGEEIGNAVLFLAQHEYITGQVLHVDGGEHLLGPINH
jgi:NAD(P)-dependent dehydrogenase (short-subunit alcohol dehydrogenase family)